MTLLTEIYRLIIDWLVIAIYFIVASPLLLIKYLYNSYWRATNLQPGISCYLRVNLQEAIEVHVAELYSDRALISYPYHPSRGKDFVTKSKLIRWK